MNKGNKAQSKRIGSNNITARFPPNSPTKTAIPTNPSVYLIIKDQATAEMKQKQVRNLDGRRVVIYINNPSKGPAE